MFNLFKKKPELKVGDRLVDKEWGDTIIEIVQVNADKTKVRYKYLKLNGQEHKFGMLRENSVSFINDYYTKIN